MIPLKFLNEKEKERLVKQLNKQFGIKELPFHVARIGKERIIVFSGDISENSIFELDRYARIEGIGLYFAKIDERTGDIRLSIEGTHLLKEQITKNIFELDEKQAEQWMTGSEINVATGKKGFVIMKFRDDFLGTGKASAEKISNFVPKGRRLKYKENKINNEQEEKETK